MIIVRLTFHSNSSKCHYVEVVIDRLVGNERLAPLSDLVVGVTELQNIALESGIAVIDGKSRRKMAIIVNDIIKSTLTN